MKRRFACTARNEVAARKRGFRRHTSAQPRAGQTSTAEIGTIAPRHENFCNLCQAPTPASVLALQRSVGNRRVQNLLARRAEELGLHDMRRPSAIRHLLPDLQRQYGNYYVQRVVA